MSSSGYEVQQEVLRTETNRFYRARRLEDNLLVLLKLPNREGPHPVTAELLQREFDFLQLVSGPGIAKALELTQFQGDQCLVLEDIGADTLPEFVLSRQTGLRPFFELGSQLSEVLAALHRQGVIYKLLNPQSLLVNLRNGEICLIDFSQSSMMPDELIEPFSVRISSTLIPYISPEQTGRMNRVTDYRSDFYSLGVLLYEVLTGVCPFRSDDRLEMIQRHIAYEPEPPHRVNAAIPEPVSHIVLKLLAKTAEERYQSALGIKLDVETCEREWAERGSVSSFPLARRDTSDRFLVSQKLYGREQELTSILEVFDSTCSGTSGFTVVSGYAGIGKTSLIRELYRPLARERGYFIAGKFERLSQIPYGGFVQAFQMLVQSLLTEGDEELEVWRARFSQALGANAGVLASVVPEMELILGKQPTPPAMGAAEAQNRFRLVFQNSVGVLASQEHPLVMFLDDLQWADPATLDLLRTLFINSDIRYLYVIGAYRDNEVDAAHPLARTLRTIELEGARLHRVFLKPLELPHLQEFVEDTLHCNSSEAESLSQLIQEKTAGNPFFVIQFLKTLKRDNLLRFDYGKGQWTFRMDEIAGAAITDNVIDLMTRKIRGLSATAQDALTLAACVGNSFDVATVATVAKAPTDTTAEHLREAVIEGLILPSSRHFAGPSQLTTAENSQTAPAYRFLHDRVQQAAYDLIPGERKQFVHLTLGRLMLDRWDHTSTGERLFELVHHLNLGSALINDSSERLALAELNLRAGSKAKNSAAYQGALSYFKAGLALLTEDDWAHHYDLAFTLHLEAAECEYLCGGFEQSENRLERLITRAGSALEKAQVYALRTVQYENMSRYADAVGSGREGLAVFHISPPCTAEDQRAALESEIREINRLLDGRTIGSLADLPEMANIEIRTVMKVLMTMWAPYYLLGEQALTRLISAMMVRLSLAHGNCEESAYGYVTHAITVGPERGDYSTAYDFGKLALAVNQRFGDFKLRAKIHQQFHAHVNLWRQPLEEGFVHSREAFRSGLETGDFTYASYGAFTESWHALLTSTDLALFTQNYSSNLDLFKRIRMEGFLDAQKIILNWALALRGLTQGKTSLSSDGMEENAYIGSYQSSPFFMIFYFVAKAHLNYIFEQYDKAIEFASRAEPIIHALSGTIWPVLLNIWTGLTLAALYEHEGGRESAEHVDRLSRLRESLCILAENCPRNFRSYSLLLSAEVERKTGRLTDAHHRYEEAIHYSGETDNLQTEALATELFARFWILQGKHKFGGHFLLEARNLYHRWGALAKVRDLEFKHPSLIIPYTRTTTRKSGFGSSDRPADRGLDSIDIGSFLKAARAIAVEIQLDSLLRKLMQIAIENAGAQRGVFLQEKDGRLFVEAEGSMDGEVSVGQSIPLSEATHFSHAVVRYARKTRESVVLGSAVKDERFGRDAYVKRTSPRSILCVPIVHQGTLSGILYLENNLTNDAFTEERAEMMRVLSGTMAISLEKAQVYEEMKQEAARRRQAEERNRTILEINNALISNLTKEALFKAISQATRRVVTFDRIAVFLHDAANDVLRLFLLESPAVPSQHFGPGLEAPVTASDVGQVFVQQSPLLRKDLESEHEYYLEELLLTEGFRSVVTVPLVLRGKGVGTLSVLSQTPNQYSFADVDFLQEVANQIALSVENMKSYEEISVLKRKLEAENVYLREEIRTERNFEEIVGSSPELLAVLRKIEQVAPLDSTVLISGETGTGKELIARAIHERSARKGRPLVKVNCSAISAGLTESELFGHIKGAFTGAIERRTGRFELADGGTIFLDEIGELPIETQVKLLRVLQEQEFEPVGSNQSIRVDVRIIAATNRDLEKAVQTGRFRSDLYYRLNVFPLHAPSLRDRKSDIPQLVTFFLIRYSQRFGKNVELVSRETMRRLVDYSWPGNVRERQNIIERAVVLCSGSTLSLDQNFLPPSGEPVDLFAPSIAAGAANSDAEVSIFDYQAEPADFASLAEIQKRHILSVLRQTGGQIEGPKGAAKVLNIHPNTLRSRMKKLGIARLTHEIT